MEITKIDKISAYIVKRIKRILPMLVVVVIASMIAGAFVTTIGIKNYFTNYKTYLYLLNAFMIPVHELPGVFIDAPYTSTVNGALWTLPLEFACNVACAIVYKMGMLKKKKILCLIPVVAIVAGALWYGIRYVQLLESVILPCVLFFVGMIFYVYKDNIRLDWRISIGCVIVLLLTSILGGLRIAMVPAFSYVMFYLWFGTNQINEKISSVGKFSYPIYLCGFPVQQFVGYCSGWNCTWYSNAFISIGISITLGIAIFNLTNIKKERRK